MITTRKRSRRKFDCLLRHSIPEEGVAWRQIIAKNRDRLRVDHYRAALLDLWEGNERSERRRRRPRSLDRKEEVTRGLEGGEVGEGTLEGRGIKRGKKEIHNTRVTNYSWAHPGSSWLQRGSHENVLWAGRVVVFRPISLSLFLFLLRAREKKKKGGKGIHSSFPWTDCQPGKKESERLEFAAKYSNETTSYSHAILALPPNYFYSRLRHKSRFVVCRSSRRRMADTWVNMFSENI